MVGTSSFDILDDMLGKVKKPAPAPQAMATEQAPAAAGEQEIDSMETEATTTPGEGVPPTQQNGTASESKSENAKSEGTQIIRRRATGKAPRSKHVQVLMTPALYESIWTTVNDHGYKSMNDFINEALEAYVQQKG